VTIKPILKYPGAKWKLAHWIVSYFPEHSHYLEPFAGSAACFFSKSPVGHEILGDLNRDITNLFQVIREHGQELARLVEFTPWSEAKFERISDCYSGTGDPIEDARRFLVRCWQAHGVRFRGAQSWKHNGLKGHQYPARRWRDVPERILAVVDRLKDAEIRNRPALELIAYYNDPECLIYADPPYVRATRNDRFYQHEMTDDEHIALLNALEAHRGPVILSGYAHPLYDSRLQHWYRVTAPAVAEHGRQRTEVLWLNLKAARLQQLPLFAESEVAV